MGKVGLPANPTLCRKNSDSKPAKKKNLCVLCLKLAIFSMIAPPNLGISNLGIHRTVLPTQPNAKHDPAPTLHSPMSWPNQQQSQVQPHRDDGSLSYSNQRMRTSLIPLCWPIHRKPNIRVREEEQRVIGEAPILTILWITDTPLIMQAWNPTAKRALKSTP